MKLFGIATTFITALVTVASAIKIITPPKVDGREGYRTGDSLTIEWRDAVGKLDIYLKKSGANNAHLEDIRLTDPSIDAATGSYNWKIPEFTRRGIYTLYFKLDSGKFESPDFLIFHGAHP